MPYRTLLTATLLSLLPACGGDGVDIDGPYVQVLGTPGKVFSISNDSLTVYCRSSSVSSTFDFEAETSEGSDTGDFFRFSLYDYKGSGEYDIDYGTGYSNKVEVGFDDPQGTAGAKGYKYWFFENFTVGSSQKQSSRCKINIEDKSGDGTTLATGWISCVLLWADQDSQDYNTGTGNPYVDLNARFACE